MRSALLTAAMLSGLPVVVTMAGPDCLTIVGKVDLYDHRTGRVVITEADGHVERFLESSIAAVRYA